MCRTCEKKCDDILKHLITVHNFSKATVESQLATNPNSYRNAFKKLRVKSIQNNEQMLVYY